jgi:hypothetical protein
LDVSETPVAPVHTEGFPGGDTSGENLAAAHGRAR